MHFRHSRYLLLCLGLLLSNPGFPSEPARVLTLEEAYDRAMATDQSIRIAYLEIRKTSRLPWRALTIYEPRLAGNIGAGRTESLRDSSSGSIEQSSIDGSSFKQTNSVTRDELGRSVYESLSYAGRERKADVVQDGYQARNERVSSAAVILEQPLLDMAVFPAWRLGKLTAQSAQLQCRLVAREVLFGVARAYFSVLKAEAVTGVDRETLKLATEQLANAEKRLQAGEALRTDVLRARVIQQEAVRKLTQSSGNLQIARFRLAAMLNMQREPDFRVVAPDTHAPALAASVNDAVRQAVVQREEVKISALAIGRERERRNQATADLLPKVFLRFRTESAQEDGSLTGLERGYTNRHTNLGESGSQTRATTGTVAQTTPLYTQQFGSSRERYSLPSNMDYSRDSSGWAAFLEVEVPLWGRRTLDWQMQNMALNQITLQDEVVVRNLEQEVRDRWVQAVTLQQSQSALKAEVEAAQQNFADLQNQYNAGTATSLDTLAALRELNAARSLQAEQTYDLEVALYDVQRAIGEFQKQRVQNLKVR